MKAIVTDISNEESPYHYLLSQLTEEQKRLMQENRCFKCKQVGHRLSECRKRKRESEFQPAINHLKRINPGSQFKPRLPKGYLLN